MLGPKKNNHKQLLHYSVPHICQFSKTLARLGINYLHLQK